MSKPGDIRIGISGWRYKPWRGVFYPKGLPQTRELAYASETFRSIEINGTFYSLQTPASFERWAAETPEDFVFAVKGPRYITHMLRLKEIKIPLANFLASGIFRLGRKLGPILWQFPPNFPFDPKRIEAFLKLLPQDTEKAAAIAKRHDKWLKKRVDVRPAMHGALRHAMEIRHECFLVKEFIDLLRAFNVALVCADAVEWPRRMDLTADFVYCRLHGSEVLYASGYGNKDLDRWAKWVAAWATGKEPSDTERIVNRPESKKPARDVYLYCDNDAKVRAPFDAKNLVARVTTVLEKQGLDRD
jgi:uncharacterized protein YecE (DUF72 family)